MQTLLLGKHWSLRSVQIRLIKIGGRLVSHARRLVSQLAEVAVPREVSQQVLELIGGLVVKATSAARRTPVHDADRWFCELDRGIDGVCR